MQSLTYAETIRVILEKLDAEGKRDLLREIIKRVVVNSYGKVQN